MRTHKTFQSISLTALLALAALPAMASPGASQDCVSAPSLGLGETVRGLGRPDGSAECFAVDVPAAGQVLVNLLVPAAAAVEPRLALATACGDSGPAPEVIEWTPAHLRLASGGAGSFVVCVEAQDSSVQRGDLRLSTTFAEVVPAGRRRRSRRRPPPRRRRVRSPS